MFRLILLAAISTLIGACASSAPETATPTVVKATQADNATESTNPASPPEKPANESADEIYSLEPSAADSSAETLAASKADEIVCRKETPTGSRFSRRVCRTRSEIEARAAKDQEEMQRMRSTTSGGQCVLEGSC